MFKIYDNIFSDDDINVILSIENKQKYYDGKVGNRINIKQKIRKDLFINNNTILKKIDNIFYNKLYDVVKKNFSDIKYREKWKIGHYKSDNKGFYNLHTDTAGETGYRKTSSVCMLSDEDDYEGGELHFPDLNKTIKLKKGQVIIFDSKLLHGVYPIKSGDRKVLISFYFDDEGMEIKKKYFKNVISNNYKPFLDTIKIEYPYENKIVHNIAEINLYNKGDIDYSDLHHTNKWNSSDDYLYENNNSDILLITFAGMGWKNSLPTFIFYNFLKSYKIDKLFLRDIKMRYYLTGLKNSTDNFKETIEFYRKLITQKKYKRIVALGCSAGGYAAILYGQLLGIDKVIAFNPQTVITSFKENVLGDIYNAPRTCKWLSSLHLDDIDYQKALDLSNFKPFTTSIDIHYSNKGSNGCDKKHALHLNDDKMCKIFEHDGNDHMIALTLRNNGKLKNIIDKEIDIDN